MATKNKNEPLVLVVDDFADAREMYGEYLKFCGFRVAEAQNGVEAIEKAKRLKPDLILMDLSMPVVDGWEATRRLKADSTTKAIPVVALDGTRDGGAFGERKERRLRRRDHQAVPAARSDQGDQEGHRHAATAPRYGQAEAHRRVRNAGASEARKRVRTTHPTAPGNATRLAHPTRQTHQTHPTHPTSSHSLEPRSRRRPAIGRATRPQPDRVHQKADGTAGDQAPGGRNSYP